MQKVDRCVISFCVAGTFALASQVQAQIHPTFSIDFQSATAGSGTPGPFTGIGDSWTGAAIDEGSILTPALPGPSFPNPPSIPGAGPLPTPGMMVSGVTSGVGVVPGGLGIIPTPVGVPGSVELDALSYGHDHGLELVFSVDEWAGGDNQPPFNAPDVTSEGTVGGVFDASADVFAYNGPVVRTTPPPVPIQPGNRNIIDGNGFPSPVGGLPGLGLIEVMPPGCGIGCNGDNLDALDINTLMSDVLGPIFFSLDSQFADPLELPVTNTGTAAGNGFSGSDILISAAGGVPRLYAPAAALGLDLNGFDTDDLDALILQDHGDGLYDPAVDRILFSVRRGSAVIGAPDSLYGIAIEEGDILSVPIPGGIGTPSIYIAAEALGLATVRSGTNQFTPYGDELDALDLFLKGDLDGDGFIGIADLNLILSNWNTTIPLGNPAADPDADGFVGIADLNIVLGNWNTGAPLPPGGTAVPEPTMLLTLGLFGTVLLSRRH
jgi:hypothetical protein